MCPPPPPPAEARTPLPDSPGHGDAPPLQGLIVEELDDDAFDTFFGHWGG